MQYFMCVWVCEYVWYKLKKHICTMIFDMILSNLISLFVICRFFSVYFRHTNSIFG